MMRMRMPANAVGPGCECSECWLRLTSFSRADVSGRLESFHPTPPATARMESAAIWRLMIDLLPSLWVTWPQPQVPFHPRMDRPTCRDHLIGRATKVSAHPQTAPQ